MALLSYVSICLVSLVMVHASFEVSKHDLKVHINNKESFDVYLTEPISEDVFVSIDAQHADLLSVDPAKFNVTKNESLQSDFRKSIFIKGIAAGHSIVNLNVTLPNITEYVYNVYRKCVFFL